MARAGKEEYKKYLERIDGDMKLTYSVVPHKTMSARQRFTYLYDAEYLLFYKKDVRFFPQNARIRAIYTSI